RAPESRAPERSRSPASASGSTMPRYPVSFCGFPARLRTFHRPHLVAIAQERRSPHDHPLTGRKTVAQFDVVAVGQSDPNRTQLDSAVADDRNAVTGGALDHRRGRNAHGDAPCNLDGAARERPNMRARLGGERDADLAEAGGLVDLACDQPDRTPEPF